MPDQLEFKISEGLIKPIIEAKINEAMISAMGGHQKMVIDIMNAYMNQVVDSEGKATSYSGKPRLYHLANKMIEDSLKAALTDYLKSKTDLMTKEFEKFFNSKKGSSQLIEAMQGGFCKALSSTWNFQVIIAPPADR
jgi:hypothetical protein